MKLSRMDRAAVVAFAALSILVIAFVCACATKPEFAFGAGYAFMNLMRSATALRVLLVVVGIALGAYIGAAAWIIAFEQGREKPQGPSLTVSRDEAGSVNISVAALEALVRRSVGEVAGVDEYEVRIAEREGGLDVTLDMSISGGARVPEIAEGVRDSVRQPLEVIAGMRVNCVDLNVTQIRPDTAHEPPGKNG